MNIVFTVDVDNVLSIFHTIPTQGSLVQEIKRCSADKFYSRSIQFFVVAETFLERSARRGGVCLTSSTKKKQCRNI